MKRAVTLFLTIALLICSLSVCFADDDVAITVPKRDQGIVNEMIHKYFPDLADIFKKKDAAVYVAGMTIVQMEQLVGNFDFYYKNDNTVLAYVGLSKAADNTLFMCFKNSDDYFLCVCLIPELNKMLYDKYYLTKKDAESFMKKNCKKQTKITGKQFAKADEIIASYGD